MIPQILQDLKSIEELLEYETLTDELKGNSYEISKFLIVNPQYLT